MQLKKILLCITLCLLTQAIPASEPSQNLTPSEKLKEAIRQHNIDGIIRLIQMDDVDINITTAMGTTALSKLCHDAVLTQQLINNLTQTIESPNNNEEAYPDTYKALKNQNIAAKKIVTKQYFDTLHAIELLLRKNVDTNAVLLHVRDFCPETTLPFFASRIHNHMQAEHSKLNINIQDEHGNTPLHKAIKFDNTHNGYSKKWRSQVLLELGADPNIRNKNGKTPADLAQPHIQPWITDPASGYRTCIESPLFSETSVRMLQMPIYKQGKKVNLCKLIRQREHGIK
jgi:hypothetical protein